MSKITKKQLQEAEKIAKESFESARNKFLKEHNVKDEKEFTERYKSKVVNSKNNKDSK